VILFFDTETTGLWNKKLPCGHPEQPRVVQLGAMLVDPETRREAMRLDLILYREEAIPEASSRIHGTTTEVSQRIGVAETSAMDLFCDMVEVADMLVAHNIEFDVNVLNNAARLLSHDPVTNIFGERPQFCTMKAGTPVCKFPNKYGGGGYGWPKLELAVPHLLGRPPTDAHRAIGDVIDCRDIFFHLQDLFATHASRADA
jgi:DNA polymerase-3 subunit epsilon